jgi:hypothetical protein
MKWKWGLGGLLVLGACGGSTQPLGDVTVGTAGSGNTAGAGGMSLSVGGMSLSVGGTSLSVGGASLSGGSASTLLPSNACEVECVREIFQRSPVLCKLCHNSMGLKSSGLDFASDGFTDRLKDVPARHADLGQGMSAQDCPVGDKLIDSVTPDNSWLLKKIRGLQGNCGTVMPSTGSLGLGQRSCVENYVYCVAAQSWGPDQPG